LRRRSQRERCIGRTWGSCKPVAVLVVWTHAPSSIFFDYLFFLQSFPSLFSWVIPQLSAFLFLTSHDVLSLFSSSPLPHLTNVFAHVYISIKNFSNFIVYLALTRTIFLFTYPTLFFLFFLHPTIDTATVDVEGRRHSLILPKLGLSIHRFLLAP